MDTKLPVKDNLDRFGKVKAAWTRNEEGAVRAPLKSVELVVVMGLNSLRLESFLERRSSEYGPSSLPELSVNF